MLLIPVELTADFSKVFDHTLLGELFDDGRFDDDLRLGCQLGIVVLKLFPNPFEELNVSLFMVDLWSRLFLVSGGRSRGFFGLSLLLEGLKLNLS